MQISRRTLFQQTGLMAAAVALWGQGVRSAKAGEFTPNKPEYEILNRFSFGIHPDDVAALESRGPAAYLEEQLFGELLDPEVEANVQTWFPTLALSAAELKSLVDTEQMVPAQIAGELKRATVYRASASRYQLYEVMVDFWSNHFNIYHQDGPLRLLKTVDDRDVIRANALGSFRALLQASAKSPAMLFYLDNYSSTKRGFNENYARELLELHTLGVDGGYSHEDIEAVARILTGWSIGRGNSGPIGEFSFFSQTHDYGEKTVMGVVYPAGQGIEEGEALLDQLVDHPSTRQFIATKLCQRFISDQPAVATVAQVAEAWGADGDIPAMLLALASTDEFYDKAARKYRRPLDYVLGMLRTAAALVSRSQTRMLQTALQLLGQVPFDYPPPTGYPDSISGWASTAGLLNRWNIASTGLGYTSGGRLRRNSILQPEILLDDPQSPEQLVDQLLDMLLHGGIDAEGREILVSFAEQRFAELETRQGLTLVRDLANLIYASPYFQWH